MTTASVRLMVSGNLCRAALCVLLLSILAGCSTLGRPVAERPLPPPAPPPSVPTPPTNIEAIPDPIPRIEPRSLHGNPPFYDVMGRRYFVLGESDGYVERGVASWYGPTFHGINTSSGEPYDMYGMTAAHKTLPLPTYARVTNLRNGRSITVRINDRGPFVSNRLIDLSYTAAAKLDMLREGTTLVEVRALTPGKPDNLTRASESPPPTLYVQVGAFANQNNAQRAIRTLQAAGLDTAFIAPPANEKPLLYRVRVGPVNNVADFDQLAAKLASLGYSGVRLALD
ncbi:MAG TPA: septal ring lytic transglycosylase RlpA family protein [Steroidobacteraceae bacterium]|nr:septal ring lytic transglycosylase RlpA family protein [Steroidobacteraceae bacterium]